MLGIVAEMHIPAGIVINRSGIGNRDMDAYLAEKNLPVLLRVPFSRELASGIAGGKNLVEIYPEYLELMQQVFMQIMGLVNGGKP